MQPTAFPKLSSLQLAMLLEAQAENLRLQKEADIGANLKNLWGQLSSGQPLSWGAQQSPRPPEDYTPPPAPPPFPSGMPKPMSANLLDRGMDPMFGGRTLAKGQQPALAEYWDQRIAQDPRPKRLAGDPGMGARRDRGVPVALTPEQRASVAPHVEALDARMRAAVQSAPSVEAGQEAAMRIEREAINKGHARMQSGMIDYAGLPASAVGAMPTGMFQQFRQGLRSPQLPNLPAAPPQGSRLSPQTANAVTDVQMTPPQQTARGQLVQQHMPNATQPPSPTGLTLPPAPSSKPRSNAPATLAMEAHPGPQVGAPGSTGTQQMPAVGPRGTQQLPRIGPRSTVHQMPAMSAFHKAASGPGAVFGEGGKSEWGPMPHQDTERPLDEIWSNPAGREKREPRLSELLTGSNVTTHDQAQVEARKLFGGKNPHTHYTSPERSFHDKIASLLA